MNVKMCVDICRIRSESKWDGRLVTTKTGARLKKSFIRQGEDLELKGIHR